MMPAVAFVFHGPTNYPATKFLRNAICGWCGGRPVQDGTVYTEMYLLLSSEGGSVEEAFSLYNLIRALPVKTTTVNMGQIASAGNILFLAGDDRWSCDHSYFHFHNLGFFYDKPQSLHRIQMLDHAQILDVERQLYKSIFKERTSLSDEDFDTLKFLEDPLIKDVGFAKEKGIIQEIGMPQLHIGIPILNVEY
jgi:ATP-dependent protease ClpP protease subunit